MSSLTPVWWSTLSSQDPEKGHDKLWGKGFICVISKVANNFQLPQCRMWIQYKMYQDHLEETFPGSWTNPSLVATPPFSSVLVLMALAHVKSLMTPCAPQIALEGEVNFENYCYLEVLLQLYHKIARNNRFIAKQVVGKPEGRMPLINPDKIILTQYLQIISAIFRFREPYLAQVADDCLWLPPSKRHLSLGVQVISAPETPMFGSNWHNQGSKENILLSPRCI